MGRSVRNFLVLTTSLTLIPRPAYIAGVTNPIFETSRTWDILCDISTGTVTVSKDIWLKWPVGPSVGISSSGSGGGLIAPLLTRTGTLKAEAAINDDVSKDGKGKLAACDICNTML
jgi:hypothetical protein